MDTHYGKHFQIFMSMDKLLNLSLATQKRLSGILVGYIAHKNC